MSPFATTLLVTGSRALTDTPAARWWATQAILRALSTLPYGSVVVTGDAVGPDLWTLDAVLSARICRACTVSEVSRRTHLGEPVPPGYEWVFKELLDS